MFHAPCVRGVGVVPSPIVLCAVSLHTGRAFHHARRARCVGVFVGRTSRSKRRPASWRSSLADSRSRLRSWQIVDDVASEVDRRHLVRRGCIGTTSTSADPLAILRQQPRQRHRDRRQRRSLRAGMRGANVAWLRKTAPRCLCSLPRDPNGQRRLSSFQVFPRRARPSASSIEAGLTEGRSRCAYSRSCPCNVRPRLSSRGRCAPFLAVQESRCRPPSALFRPFGCRSIASGLTTAIEVPIGAARENQGNETMATIGTFTSTGNGFSGAIKTLNLNVKAKLVRVENPSEQGPHFRIFAASSVELGAPWQKFPTRPATTSRSSWTTRASPLRSAPP